MLFFGSSRERTIWDPPTRLEVILQSPLKYLTRLIHRFLTSLRSGCPPTSPSVRVVCISDTHCNTYPIPDGDLLIHAGDLTNAGTIPELQAQIDWLSSLPHPHKVAIAGNHDTYLDPRSRKTLAPEDREGQLDWKGIHYLQHTSVELSFHTDKKLKIYGAPQIPTCGGSNFAFQYPRYLDAWAETIPADVDILVTHTPPKYHRDLPLGLGCESLLKETWRVRPRLHLFGHVHAGAGRELVWWDEAQAAFERLRALKGRGLLRDVFSIRKWTELAKVTIYGISGLLWNRVWGGEQREGILVNAALMYNNTGVLKNPVQVVEM